MAVRGDNADVHRRFCRGEAVERLRRLGQRNGKGVIMLHSCHVFHVPEEGDGARIVRAIGVHLRHVGWSAYDHVKLAR